MYDFSNYLQKVAYQVAYQGPKLKDIAYLEPKYGYFTYFEAQEGFDCQTNAQALDNGTTPTKQP